MGTSLTASGGTDPSPLLVGRLTPASPYLFTLRGVGVPVGRLTSWVRRLGGSRFVVVGGGGAGRLVW